MFDQLEDLIRPIFRFVYSFVKEIILDLFMVKIGEFVLRNVLRQDEASEEHAMWTGIAICGAFGLIWSFIF